MCMRFTYHIIMDTTNITNHESIHLYNDINKQQKKKVDNNSYAEITRSRTMALNRNIRTRLWLELLFSFCLSLVQEARTEEVPY